MEPVLTDEELEDIYAAARDEGPSGSSSAVDDVVLTASREFDERTLKAWRVAGQGMEPAIEAVVAGALSKRSPIKTVQAEIIRPEAAREGTPWSNRADETVDTLLRIDSDIVVIGIASGLARAFIGRRTGVRQGFEEDLGSASLTALERQLLSPLVLSIGAAATQKLPRRPAIEIGATSADEAWQTRPEGQTWIELSLAAVDAPEISIWVAGPATALAPKVAGQKSVIQNHMERARVEVAAELGVFTMTVGEFRELHPGQLVVLDTTVGDALALSIGGVPKLSGEPMVSRGNLALRIKGRMDTREAL